MRLLLVTNIYFKIIITKKVCTRFGKIFRALCLSILLGNGKNRDQCVSNCSSPCIPVWRERPCYCVLLVSSLLQNPKKKDSHVVSLIKAET